ncbi:hypothetical protein V8F33_010300 [Rhypophila sp. PSN 637]
MGMAVLFLIISMFTSFTCAEDLSGRRTCCRLGVNRWRIYGQRLNTFRVPYSLRLFIISPESDLVLPYATRSLSR